MWGLIDLTDLAYFDKTGKFPGKIPFFLQQISWYLLSCFLFYCQEMCHSILAWSSFTEIVIVYLKVSLCQKSYEWYMVIVSQVQNLKPRICYAKVCVICKLQMYEVAHIVSAGLNTQLPENLTCIHFGQSTVAKTLPLWIEYYPIWLPKNATQTQCPSTIVHNRSLCFGYLLDKTGFLFRTKPIHVGKI